MAKTSNFLTGLLAGAVVGAVAGLILAPKPGKETRELVGTRTNEIRNRAGYYVENVRGRFKRESDEDAIEIHSDNGVQG
ncbi:MAG: YtxH domain-containing protein [Chloroflexi bacterium]|nr:YtxH domain-containing protein [Chloroflexota bacterium]PKB57480.1 MAG: hypothetical protein BZY73_02975 [SAR202 cluster bacterium Casp-Chloro-G3]